MWFASHRDVLVASTALLILRCVFGIALALHGWQKFSGVGGSGGWMGPETPVPAALQTLATYVELGGGVAWVLGVCTRLASVGVACDMLAAICLVHLPQHQPLVAPLGHASYELAAHYLTLALVLLLVGPGAFSAEGMVRQLTLRVRARREIQKT